MRALFALSRQAGCTCLHEACSQGHAEIARLLLERHAPVSAVDREGSTPIMGACAGGSAEIVGLLLERGASVSGVDAV